jgi:integrase
LGRRRGKGEGSIYKRKDGLWVGQYHVDTGLQKKTKYIYGKTRKAVAAKLAKAIADRDTGLFFDSESLRVGQYLDKWLGTVRDTVKDRTLQRHEEVVRLHLKPSFGKVRLDKLTAVQVQSLYLAKLDAGLSPRTVQIIHTTLHKALKQAVTWRLIPNNVARSVDPPQAPRKEIRPLSREQVKSLLAAAKETELYALYVLAVTTGMRQGELLGLKWEDVDLGRGTLQVRRTVFGGQISAPKTSRGKRSIALTRATVRALRGHPKRAEWVFSSRVGTPIRCHNLINRCWKPLLAKAGLPLDIRFHDLRHTCATLLLANGVHPKIVQEMLGHSTISITLDTYSHVLPNMQKEAVKAMEDLTD